MIFRLERERTFEIRWSIGRSFVRFALPLPQYTPLKQIRGGSAAQMRNRITRTTARLAVYLLGWMRPNASGGWAFRYSFNNPYLLLQILVIPHSLWRQPIENLGIDWTIRLFVVSHIFFSLLIATISHHHHHYHHHSYHYCGFSFLFILNGFFSDELFWKESRIIYRYFVYCINRMIYRRT